jgi:hypothetical protein
MKTLVIVLLLGLSASTSARSGQASHCKQECSAMFLEGIARCQAKFQPGTSDYQACVRLFRNALTRCNQNCE